MSKIKGLLAAAVFMTTMGMLSGCSFSMMSSYLYQNAENYTAGDLEITGKIDAIDIDYTSGEVKLNGSASNTVTVKETSNKQLDDKQKVHTWVEGTTLHVRYCASGKGISLSNLNKKLEISVPKNVKLSDVTVDVSSADVTCDDIEAEDLCIESSSGDISANAKAKKIRLETSSGDTALCQSGDSEEITAESSSGRIAITMENAQKVSASASSGGIAVTADKVKTFDAETSSGRGTYWFGETPENIDIEASSGDVEIALPEDADLTADFDTSSGDITFELAFSKNGDTYVCGKGTNQMNVETSSGDITVRIAD